MFAVVLVGGFGTRLRPLTNDVPKPMLPVGHRPMIVGLVDRLGDAGVTDVVLALGFQPEPFVDAFPDGRHGAVRVHYAVEPEPLDTGGAIAFAARQVGIDDTFLALNGDNICDVDYAMLYRWHRERGHLGTIHLSPVTDPSSFGVVESDSEQMVRRFVEKPQPGETSSNEISSGAYVLEPGVVDLIASDRKVSIERETFPLLVEREQLDALATADYWTDTGRPELLRDANLALIDGTRHVRVDPVEESATVAADAIVQHSVISGHSTLDAGATAIDSLVYGGASIGAGAHIERSIVAGTVASGVRVTDAVIGPTATVTRDVDGERIPAADK